MRFSLVTSSLVLLLIAACLWGGYWAWGTLFYISVFAYGVDRLTPFLIENAPSDAEFPVATPLSVVLAFAHFGVLGLALVALVQIEAPLMNKMALFFAVSLFAGQVGHPNAHELIHHPNRWMRRLGRAVYMSILMGHHASSHPLVHHVHVGTERDPVSAPKGRGFWRFFGRAWIGSYRAGYAAEAARLKQGRRHPYLGYHLGAVAVLVAAFALAGLVGVLICAAIGLYAQLQIFLSDYVQHYGLRRKILPNGKPEP
ncbi:fatty acid desaturase, partial [Planktotalea sp.]|uniref:fatty acid desaturase n=1 Tax=Planktotalea sp. TaxID=2029877 RepID=UPI003296DA03